MISDRKIFSAKNILRKKICVLVFDCVSKNALVSIIFNNIDFFGYFPKKKRLIKNLTREGRVKG